MLTGSLQSRKGKYYSIMNLKDENGERKQKSIPLHIEDKPGNLTKARKAHRETITEWEKKLAEEARVKLKPPDPNCEILLCDYINIWLIEARENLQPNTFEAYKSSVDKHIYPYFKTKDVRLADVVYSDIKNYYTVKNKSLSGNTLKKHHALIRQTLRKAVQDGLLASNPAAEVTLPKAKKFVGNFLTIEQGKALLDAAKATPLEPVVVLAMMYGLRRSEIAGLKWSAVDLKNDTLTVRHTVTRFKTVVAKDSTKNNSSHRVLPLNSSVKEFLLRLRAQQAQDRLILGQAYQSTEYVCRWPDGHAISPDYMSAAFHKLLKQRGFDPIRLHDLRHSCASYMLKSGCSMKEISDWLGHADIGTSMNIYAHLDTDAKKDVSNRLGAMLAL